MVNYIPCKLFNNGERTCKQICKNVLYLIKEDFCKSDNHKECPYYKIFENPELICEFIMDCNENDFAFLMPFEKMLEVSNNYCLNTENKESCERYKKHSEGITPHDKLLPDGTVLIGDLFNPPKKN
jgi:hypothetical protein